MSKCYECRRDVQDGVFRCDECIELIKSGKLDTNTFQDSTGRGLNDWQKLKLTFDRSEKEWHRNIESRRPEIVNGKKVITYETRRGTREIMPTPPKDTWAKPKSMR